MELASLPSDDAGLISLLSFMPASAVAVLDGDVVAVVVVVTGGGSHTKSW